MSECLPICSKIPMSICDENIASPTQHTPPVETPTPLRKESYLVREGFCSETYPIRDRLPSWLRFNPSLADYFLYATCTGAQGFKDWLEIKGVMRKGRSF